MMRMMTHCNISVYGGHWCPDAEYGCVNVQTLLQVMDVTGRGISSSFTMDCDLIIFISESIPFSHSTSKAQEVSATIQHLAAKHFPWPIFLERQSEPQQPSETSGAVFWKSSILQGNIYISCELVMLVFPPISWLPVATLFLPPAPDLRAVIVRNIWHECEG